jgi:hypothetical protein
MANAILAARESMKARRKSCDAPRDFAVMTAQA